MTTPLTVETGEPADLASVVLFDLDGTLTDSAPGIINGFRHALATVGAPPPEPAALAHVIGPPLIDTFRGMGLNEADTQVALDAYFARYDDKGWSENSVFDGVEPVLAALRADGIRLGVATSKRESFAHRILGHFELAHYFDFIGGASDDLVRRSKRDVIAHSLSNLGLQPTLAEDGGTPGVLMVGDRHHDIDGAALFGIPAVFVDWGYGVPAEADTAAWRVASPAELSEVLRANTL